MATKMSDNPIPTELQEALERLENGRYHLEREVGRGGMATVYLARDTRLHRLVAIKVLHRHLIDDPNHHQRFRREAESIARLDHPGILEIYDLLELPGQVLAIVMEYVAGLSLEDLIARSAPIPPELAAQALIPVLDALSCAHDQGVIHRDLKPANILVDEDASLRITDFGIAHVAYASTLTDTGSIVGSPAFMAPEMAEGQPVDHRVDLFAAGSILFFMVTAELPFSGTSPPQLLRNIADGRRQRADHVREAVGRRFADLLETFLSTDPDGRPSSADDAAGLLDDFIQASLGEDRPDLQAWKNEPETYSERLRQQIADALRRRADQAVDDGRRRRGIAAVERLLALQPGDPQASEMLDQLHPDPPRTIFIAAAVAIAALVLVAGAMFYLPETTDKPRTTTPDSPAAPAASDATEQTDAAAEVARQSAIRALALHHTILGAEAAFHVEASARRRGVAIAAAGNTAVDTDPQTIDESAPPATDSADTERDPSPASDDAVPLRFRLIPASATLRVGDREFDAVEAARGFELPIGEHDLVARAPGCQPHRQTLRVEPDTAGEHSIVLDWKDGYIRLTTDRDAVVWVGDRNTPHRIEDGEEERLAVSFGPADTIDSRREIELRAAPRDDVQRVRTKTVSVRPDTETSVAISLDEER